MSKLNIQNIIALFGATVTLSMSSAHTRAIARIIEQSPKFEQVACGAQFVEYK